MSKTIFVSNRLPVTVSKEDDELQYSKSIGGLATGLKSYHESSNGLWAGWPGVSEEGTSDKEKESIGETLEESYNCLPVFLSNEEIDRYYYGFSNKTIWPLFHYFSNKAEYNVDTWDAYYQVNRKFFDAIKDRIEEDDIIWVHDYQLMLLPEMIREVYPNVRIGFFLHIPFPSYEVFRMLVWREEILKGLLGADLIGFHTYDYVRHFLSSVRRILGYEHNLNNIVFEDRLVKADVFPMGIDYDRFSKEYTSKEFKKEEAEIVESIDGVQMILSIDRLDYTKGIPERIKAYDRFLEKNPEYVEKVRLNLIVAPSREAVDSYEQLKREIQILVSETNGKYGTVSWMPIWFFFQSFPQESLIAFYKHSEVLLVTPLRDGMNLVVKEYIAARTDYEGMVVISETAGAASELGEAVIVNANDTDEIADGIKTALEMPGKEKRAINRIMHRRLKRYNVEFWAEQFMNNLAHLETDPLEVSVQKSLERDNAVVVDAYKEANKRLLFIDYDGTLVGFKSIPEKAKPDKEVRRLLQKLTDDPKNKVVIVSGRDRLTLDDWLGDMDLHILASHGLWLRHPGEDWRMTVSLNNDWKATIHHVLEVFTDRMPGSLIEEKEYSLAFHYRQCEPDMVATKFGEVKEALLSMTQSMSLGLQEGNKVLEIKDNRVNKGQGVSIFAEGKDFDFIMSIGDDVTDEDLFDALPEDSYTIKVGMGHTAAKYRVRSWRSVRQILGKFVK